MRITTARQSLNRHYKICLTLLAVQCASWGLPAVAAGKVKKKPQTISHLKHASSVEEALHEPSRLKFSADRVTLKEFIEQVATVHGLSVRFDKNLAAILVAETENVLVAGDMVPQKSSSTNASSLSHTSLPIPFMVQATPVYAGTTPPATSLGYTQDVSYPNAPTVVAPSAVPTYSAQPETGSVQLPVSEGPAANTISAQAVPASVQPESSIPVYQANKPVAVNSDVETASEEAEEEQVPSAETLHLASRISEVLLASEISTAGLTTTNSSLESVLRHALDSITTQMDVANIQEGIGFPVAMTHAFDLTLLIAEDHVLITTVVAANLAKTTIVYPVGDLATVDAEALKTVITKTIRPWSWRSQINSLVNQVSADWPDSIDVPKIKIDLTGLATGQDGEQAEPSDTTKVDLKGLKAMGELASSGTIAFAQTLISGSEMMHFADPPTADIEVLPGMLVITQSQAAHREIENLLDQIRSATAKTATQE